MKRFFRIFFSRGWVTKLCFGIITAFVFIAVFAPVLTRYTPYEQNLRYILAGPSGEHLLGCDNIGRDTLTRLLYGARVSLITGLLSSIWAAILGTSIGLIAGYVGGWLNTLVMRITDAMIAIPPYYIYDGTFSHGNRKPDRYQRCHWSFDHSQLHPYGKWSGNQPEGK